jgi:hypothetical protein
MTLLAFIRKPGVRERRVELVQHAILTIVVEEAMPLELWWRWEPGG